MKLPNVWRRKRGRREFGSFYCEIKGERINLRTQSRAKALGRAAAAMRGDRSFESDSQGAAKLIAALDGGDSARKTLSLVDPLAVVDGGVAGAASTPPGEPPAPPPPPPPEPEVIEPEPVAPGDTGWTDDVRGAAAAAEAEATPPPVIDPAWLDLAIKKAAVLLVEAQLWTHDWCARRWGEVELGKVLPDDPTRAAPQAIWEAFIRRHMPAELPIPDWLLAPILVAGQCLPVQIAGAKPIPKKEQQPASDDAGAAETRAAA